jgi:hypothetical protein
MIGLDDEREACAKIVETLPLTIPPNTYGEQARGLMAIAEAGCRAAFAEAIRARKVSGPYSTKESSVNAAEPRLAVATTIQAMRENGMLCVHYWISNSGFGGEPEFRPNRQMSSEPLMHVKCSLCDARTWFTEKQWRAIP